MPIVIDNFLPEAVREDGLCAPFVEWPAHDGEVYKRVALVDFYNDFKNQFAHPEQYQYTNVTFLC